MSFEKAGNSNIADLYGSANKSNYLTLELTESMLENEFYSFSNHRKESKFNLEELLHAVQAGFQIEPSSKEAQ